MVCELACAVRICRHNIISMNILMHAVHFQAQSGHGVMGIMASLVMEAVMVAELLGLSTNCRALVLYVSSVDHSFLWH